MNPTITQGEYKAEKSNEKELTRLLHQARSVLNVTQQQGPFKQTTAATAAYITLWTSDEMAQASAWEVRAKVVGIATTGAGANYEIAAMFVRIGSAATTQVGATQVLLSIESAAAFDARFVASGNSVLLQVIDDGVETMNWSAVTFAREVK